MIAPQPELPIMVLLVLMSYITTAYSTEIEQHMRIYINKEINEFHLQSVCDGQYENGIEVGHFFCQNKDCFYGSEDSYDEDDWIFSIVSESCNGKKSCNYEQLKRDGHLVNCELDIFYTCRRKEKTVSSPRTTRTSAATREETKKTVSPPRTTRTSAATTEETSTINGTDDKKTEDDDDDDEFTSFHLILVITIAVSVVAFIALFVVIVLCGLFICGWSPRFERWNKARRERKQQSRLQQQNHPARTDEYTYIDQDYLLSHSNISSSPSQPGAFQVKWRTPDVCDVTQPSRSAKDNYEYVDEITENITADQSPRTTLSNKSPFLALPMPGSIDGVKYLRPMPVPLVHHTLSSYQNNQSISHEYSLPIPKSPRSMKRAQTESSDVPTEGASQEAHGNSESKVLERCWSHSEKIVSPNQSVSRVPASFRQVSPKPSTILKQVLPTARRASLPRHSKLMEGEIDLEAWALLGQAGGKSNSTSQPSLMKHSSDLQSESETQLYSHLRNHNAVPVVGNIYNG
ncbi:hypothetical protein RRG08_040254 [Elysia crispata]|uniref:SUEL-type lectin domain-containing protein n=1 Tax=Elysia crispata TaxID=231223 RepID=A0AAE0YA96_9GAST|nr:hypothetical protein RRG08_040254 [Elysia crispata]